MKIDYFVVSLAKKGENGMDTFKKEAKELSTADLMLIMKWQE